MPIQRRPVPALIDFLGNICHGEIFYRIGPLLCIKKSYLLWTRWIRTNQFWKW